MTASTPFRLLVPRRLLAEVVTHARVEAPLECCGLLAGSAAGGIATVTTRLPLTNALASPTRFAAEPRELLAAFRAMRDDGTELLAVYHSHPTTAAVPSRTDRAENHYGRTAACVIVSLAVEPPVVGVWWLGADGSQPADWEEFDG